MAKLHKFTKRVSISQRLLRKTLGEKTYDQFHPIGTALVNAETPVAPPPVVPMPDEEDIRRARRRSTVAQLGRSGRAATILSDSDRLGP